MYILKNAEVMKWREGNEQHILLSKFPSLLSSDTSIKIYFGDERLFLAKGEMIFLCADKKVKLVKEAHQFVHLNIVSYQNYNLVEENDDVLLYQAGNELPANWVVAGSETLPYRAITILQELTANQISSEPYLVAKQNYLLEELLHLFTQALKPYGKKVDFIMREALDYMNRHYDQNLTRSQLAELMGFNTSYFSRLFQKQVGRSFSNHLTRVRVDKAKMYLLSSDATLNDIASKVGYADGLYLSRKFKQIVGIAPREYRRQPKPTHIVALQYSGDLLALGIQPIAAPFTPWEVSPLLREELCSTIDLEQENGMQQLENTNIDLIVAPEYLYYWPGKLEKLEQLAPVLVLPWNQLDRLEAVQLMGRIVGREATADEWVQHYLAITHCASSKLESVVQVGETVGLYEVWEDQTICIWNTTARATYNLYNGLKLKPHPRIRQEVLDVNNHLFITEALLSEYAADHMFIVLTEEYYDHFPEKLRKRKAWRELLNDPSKKVYPIKLNDFWCNDGVALEKQLDIMLEKLLNT
ncbi:AraC family transcriptional regulator [Lysinibacillus fusiformis]|nr:AraC family transcriptional regulator [Lysinibacillus fusiformis]